MQTKEEDTIPDITVVMSVYNSADFLRQSIESVLSQTFKNFEFIIVNDGSTDASAAILNEYAIRDSRIKVINQENHGLTKSLNRALLLAKAPYIVRQDADDVSFPQRFSFQKEYLDTNPEIYLLGSCARNIDEKGEEERCSINAMTFGAEFLRTNIVYHNHFCHSSVMFRRNEQKPFFYDEAFRYAQDYELWIRMIKKHKAVIHHDPLVYVRTSAGMISIKKKRAQVWYALHAKMKALSLVSNWPLFLYYVCKDIALLLLPRTVILALKVCIRKVGLMRNKR